MKYTMHYTTKYGMGTEKGETDDWRAMLNGLDSTGDNWFMMTWHDEEGDRYTLYKERWNEEMHLGLDLWQMSEDEDGETH